MRKEVKERENEKGSQRTEEREKQLKDGGKRKEVKGQVERGPRTKDRERKGKDNRKRKEVYEPKNKKGE